MPEYMGKLMTQLLRLGVLPFITDNRIHVVPPAIVTPEEVAQTLSTYNQALAAVALRLSYNDAGMPLSQQHVELHPS